MIVKLMIYTFISMLLLTVQGPQPTRTMRPTPDYTATSTPQPFTPTPYPGPVDVTPYPGMLDGVSAAGVTEFSGYTEPVIISVLAVLLWIGAALLVVWYKKREKA
jgi:hypothetical protein